MNRIVCERWNTSRCAVLGTQASRVASNCSGSTQIRPWGTLSPPLAIQYPKEQMASASGANPCQRTAATHESVCLVRLYPGSGTSDEESRQAAQHPSNPKSNPHLVTNSAGLTGRFPLCFAWLGHVCGARAITTAGCTQWPSVRQTIVPLATGMRFRVCALIWVCGILNGWFWGLERWQGGSPSFRPC